jgi:hypothetical protein
MLQIRGGDKFLSVVKPLEAICTPLKTGIRPSYPLPAASEGNISAWRRTFRPACAESRLRPYGHGRSNSHRSNTIR